VPKLRVGLLFGGRSVEHAVSIASARSILDALDRSRYDVDLVAIDQDGRWHLGSPSLPPEATVKGEEVTLPAVPGEHTLVSAASSEVERSVSLDVVFPIIHGQCGEDGTLQGLLELADVAYVGSGVLGSALQMDKEVSKRLLAAAGLPVVPWEVVRKRDLLRDPEAECERSLSTLTLPVFVKPANLGSSVGIRKVNERAELLPALREAARYDEKVLVERAVDAREVEVALLGTDPVEASVPGEIRTSHEFYDYDAKYQDRGTELLIPAPVSEQQTAELQRLARVAFRVLEGAGLGRIDFFIERGTDEIFINEVNSLPGFTQGSMFPLLWEATGIPYGELLDRLIQLALSRHEARSALTTHYGA